MDADTYWDSLTDSQRQAVNDNLNRADEMGLDIAIVDAVDIWYLLPDGNRGERPRG